MQRALSLLFLTAVMATAGKVAAHGTQEVREKADVAGTVVAPEPMAPAKQDDPNSKVVVLNDSNWKTHGPPAFPDETWVVKFYAPWCGHCKSLAPDWVRLADDLSEETGSTKYRVAKADVTGGADKIGELYSVQSFPMLLRFSGGKFTQFQGQRHLAGLLAWATTIPDPALESSEPNPYLQMLSPMKLVGYLMRGGKMLERQFVAHPCYLLVLGGVALGMVALMGYLLGREIKFKNLNKLWIQFPKLERWTRFGLTSLDPAWVIKRDAKLGPGMHYVNKEDPSKHYEIPASMSFRMPEPPPPPPPLAGNSKKAD